MSSKEILRSGMLELYLLDGLDSSGVCTVEKALERDALLQKELADIEHAFFLLARENAITPSATVKPLLFAKIDYLERLAKGEIPAKLPLLNERSRIEDFSQWLSRDDMQIHPKFDQTQVIIISDEPNKMTAIVWLLDGASPETHDTEIEKFLIIEGTCNLVVGTKTHLLQPGNYLSIPLHISHHVEVTSDIPCKIILQRVKA